MTEPEFWYKKGVPQSKIMANKDGIRRVQKQSKTGKSSLVDYEKRPKKKWTINEVISLSIAAGAVAVTLAYGIHLLDVINDKNIEGLRNINNLEYNITQIVENGNEDEMIAVYDKLVEILKHLNDEKAKRELADIEMFKEQIEILKVKEGRDYTREINSYWSSILIVASRYNLLANEQGMSK